MKTHRRLLMVPGEPAHIASLAALRLAAAGDQLEPVSATEFIWRPQPAERRLFRCPASVRVLVLPGEGDQATVVLEWRGGLGGSRVGAIAVSVALGGLLAALVSVGGQLPAWKLAMALWPVLLAGLTPALFDSGWQGRLVTAASATPPPVLADAPESWHWLTLAAPQRAAALAQLTARAAVAAAGNGQVVGQDRRSAAEVLGWPLWHIATGRDPLTGRWRLARGWYARGQHAQGLMAVGQKAQGWLAIGQLAYGLVAVGQLGIGLVASVGQLALGGLLAVAQLLVALIGVGQVALAMAGASLIGRDMPVSYVLALALGLPAGIVLLVLAARARLDRVEQQVLAERVAGAIPSATVADEASLSPASRLTGDGDLERGLSRPELDARA
jgi:hypothetical protein